MLSQPRQHDAAIPREDRRHGISLVGSYLPAPLSLHSMVWGDIHSVKEVVLCLKSCLAWVLLALVQVQASSKFKFRIIPTCTGERWIRRREWVLKDSEDISALGGLYPSFLCKSWI